MTARQLRGLLDYGYITDAGIGSKDASVVIKQMMAC
jgi:hypothetical protein